MDWASFVKARNLERSMSLRGDCHDYSVAASFFHLLKRERIRRRTYKTREDARLGVLDCSEMFYNPKRKHTRTKSRQNVLSKISRLRRRTLAFNLET